MAEDILSDGRAATAVERLLEDSWAARSRRAATRELVSEAAVGAGFLAAAIPLAVLVLLHGGPVDWGMCGLLTVVYGVVTRVVRFPVGAGHILPSWLVLAPMLVLLPAGLVPLLVCLGLLIGSAARVLLRRGHPQEMLFAVPDAWHAVGPALVLDALGRPKGPLIVAVAVASFLSGCVVDLASSTIREWWISEVAPHLQLRVVARVWMLDACFAPLGVGIGLAAEHDLRSLLLLIPLGGLLVFVNRDRTARIAQEQGRLAVLARERARLQAAVNRLGDAFAAKLDLGALADVLVRSSVEALDARAGRFALGELDIGCGEEAITPQLHAVLSAATRAARDAADAVQLSEPAGWALGLPFSVSGAEPGAIGLARADRPFSDDERALVRSLVEHAELAAAEIEGVALLHEQSRTDPLTGLGNRRQLVETMAASLAAAPDQPAILAMLDLDGFKGFNDVFGHPAGDALLARLGARLRAAVGDGGSAYRLGGDEFCALVPDRGDGDAVRERLLAALDETAGAVHITASCGAVHVPAEADGPTAALALADERMYGDKRRRRGDAAEQVHAVLRAVLGLDPAIREDQRALTALVTRVGRRLEMSVDELEIMRAAADLRDIGRLVDPRLAEEADLDGEPGLAAPRRDLTVLARRVLERAPALAPVAEVLRGTLRRYDGVGDAPEDGPIPLAASVLAVCGAHEDLLRDPRCGTRAAASQQLRAFAGTRFDPVVVGAVLELTGPRGVGVQSVGAAEGPVALAGLETDAGGRSIATGAA